MNAAETDPTEIVVMPIRFTDHLPQLRDFLSVLGFSPRVSRADKWVEMVGDSGMVALHAADISGEHSGQTGLAFDVTDIDALSAQFVNAGFPDVEIYDEAYGRVLRVRGHDGAQLSFDEGSADRYGCRIETPRPQHGIVSMPLQFGPPAGPVGELLAAAGFARLDEGDDEWWRVWRSNGGGLIALHPAGADRMPGSVQFGFRTRQSLAELADRLAGAGRTDVALSEDFGGELTVTDPDGEKVLIQPVP